MDKISIVVPVYNVELYLRECLDSILNQTYSNKEVIIVNDGSEDNSLNIALEYAKRENVKLINQDNRGLSVARNVGLAASTGKYVVFIDSDDFWTNNQMLSILAEYAKTHDYDFITFNGVYYYGDRGPASRNMFRNIEIDNSLDKEVKFKQLIKAGYFNMSAWSKFIKRDFLISNNIEFIPAIYGEDTPWFLEMYRKCSNFLIINNSFYSYRQSVSGSITSGFSEKQYSDLKYVIDLEIDNSKKLNSYETYLSYVAYIYVMFIYNCFKVMNSNNRKYIMTDLKSFKWLLGYHLHPRVCLVYYIYRSVGFSILRILLMIYKKIRR